MPAGNYDEGIDRIHLVDAHRHANQDFLRHRQAKRMRSRILGTVAAIVILLSLIGSYWYHAESRKIAAIYVFETANLLTEEKFDQALIAADYVIEKNVHPWYGYLYGTVALVHLGRYEEAVQYANKMVSYIKKGPFLPERFLWPFLYAHKLNGTIDMEYEALLSQSTGTYFRQALRQAMQDVQKGAKICYPIIRSPEMLGFYVGLWSLRCFARD